MKKIFHYHKEYLMEEFHPGLFLFVVLFLGTCIRLNYIYDFEHIGLEGMGRNPMKSLAYFGFYLFPWLVLFIARGIITRKWFENHSTENWKMWLGLGIGTMAISIANWFPYHRDLAALVPHGHGDYFIRKTGWNIKNSLIYAIPLFIFWKLFDKKQERFYGLTIHRFDPKPYLILLSIVLPGIIWASFDPDFLQTYPQYRSSLTDSFLGLPKWTEIGLYEFFYGLDFTFVELFFRGFLVIGLAKWLGKGAILPMVGMYCFLHFGKPYPETISSCFGGLALGIIALNTRSILGGVMVHIGVAWMMDAAAMIQKEFGG